MVGSVLALIALGLAAVVGPTDPVSAAAMSRSPLVNPSRVRTEGVVFTTTPHEGPTATLDASSPPSTAPLDLGSDAGSSSGGGLSNGHVAALVIGGVLVVAAVVAALIGRRRRRQN